MKLRASIFSGALVVLMVATFQDAAAVLARWSNPFLLYVPAAVIAAALLFHARVPPRLPENFAWYVVLAVLAIAQVGLPFSPWPGVAAAKPLLLVVTVMVLLRLKPRIGDLYQGEVMPGFTAFLAFAALLSQSIPIVKDLAAAGITHPAIEKIPGPMANLLAAAIVAALFIMASGIRHRSLQPCPAKGWLWAGLVLYALGAAAAHNRALLEYATYTLVAAHLLLFIGALYLLSHLLPRREADELQ